MERIISVMSSEVCKDSLTELLDLPFNVFYQLELNVYVATLRKEERAWNEYQVNKNR